MREKRETMECKPVGTSPCSTQKKNKTLHVVSPVKAQLTSKVTAMSGENAAK